MYIHDYEQELLDYNMPVRELMGGTIDAILEYLEKSD